MSSRWMLLKMIWAKRMRDELRCYIKNVISLLSQHFLRIKKSNPILDLQETWKIWWCLRILRDELVRVAQFFLHIAYRYLLLFSSLILSIYLWWWWEVTDSFSSKGILFYFYFSFSLNYSHEAFVLPVILISPFLLACIHMAIPFIYSHSYYAP